MTTLSSLTALLLLNQGRRRDSYSSRSDESECDETAAGIVLDSSPEDFIRQVCGTAPESAAEEKAPGEEVPPLGDKLNVVAQSRLLCPREWTFASSPYPDTVLGWHAVKENQFAYILHTWSQITTHLVSCTLREGTSVSFFPSSLSDCIVPSLNNDCCNNVYHEVRAHIPINLVHMPCQETISSGEPLEEPMDLQETLTEFLQSRVLHARQLRRVIHDACMKFMSDSGCAVPISPRDEALQRRDSCFSAAAESSDDDMLCTCCGCNRKSFRPVHYLLLPLGTDLAPPTPVVFTLGIKDNTTRCTAAGTDEEGNSEAESERKERNVIVSIHAVVRVTRTRSGDAPRWSTEMLAYKTLTSLLPAQFAVQGASTIEVGEIGRDGCVSAWFQHTGVEVFRAEERMQETWERLPPSPKPLPACTSTLSASGRVKTQHDPYCVLTRSPTSWESQAVDSRNLESAEEGDDYRSMSAEFSYNGVNSCEQTLNKSFDPHSNSRTLADVPEEPLPPKEEEHEEEEEVEKNDRKTVGSEEKEEQEEMSIDETKKDLLSLTQELSQYGRQVTELQRTLQCQLYLLLIQYDSRKGESTLRRRKNRGNRPDGDDDTGTSDFLSAFLGTTAEAVSEDARLQKAIEILTKYGCDDGQSSSNVYATLDDCINDASEMIQTLETHLRTKTTVIADMSMSMSLSCSGKQTRGAASLSKSGRKRKNVTSLFAPAVKCLTQETHKPNGTVNKKPGEKNTDVSNGSGNVMLRGSVSAIAEARQLIEDTFAKLRAAVDWGRQRSIDLSFTCELCRAVLVPCLEARTQLAKAEQKARSDLQINYVVASAIVRDTMDTENTEEEEEEMEEEEVKEETRTNGVHSAKEKTVNGTNGLEASSRRTPVTGRSANSTPQLMAMTPKRRKYNGTPTLPQLQLTTILQEPTTPLLSQSRRRKNSGTGKAKKPLSPPVESAVQKPVLNAAFFALFLCGVGAAVCFL